MFVEQGFEVKADPFSLESLIAWLEKMPADGRYNFRCWGECMLAQWMRSIDQRAIEHPRRAHGYQYLVRGERIDLSEYRLIATAGVALDPSQWTFGAALTRARAALAEQRK